MITTINSIIHSIFHFSIISFQKLAMNLFTSSLVSFLLLLLLLSSIILISTPFVHSVSNNNGGFTVDLFHRESPKSPSYDPTKTRFERLRGSINRSISRMSSLGFEAPATSADGEYLMRIAIGTPPAEEYAIVDTGSDLTWFQCQPCQHCYRQKLPVFNPAGSSSYRPLSCESDRCKEASDEPTCGTDKSCIYKVFYGDGSESIGDVAAETLTFDGGASFPGVAFGCGHQNAGLFDDSGSGIVGLGGGAVSIINQLRSTIGGKFSYCLTLLNSNATSKISFGTAAAVGGDRAVSTPLVKKSPDTFYYLTLEGFSVGEERIDASSAAESDTEGNIIIDSGTTLTFVPQDIYDGLEAALVKAVTAERVLDPQRTFGLCYRGKVEAPPAVTAHFKGADVVVAAESVFMEVEEGIVCLTLLPSEGFGIFGNLHQMNYRIGYDLVNGEVSFLKTDCSKGEGETE